MGLQIRIRDYLINKFPIVVISKSYDTSIRKEFYIDLKLLSYVTKVYDIQNNLLSVDSKRFDLTQYYKVRFNNDGYRIYSLWENDNEIEFKHVGFDIKIKLEPTSTKLFIINKKGALYEQEGY